MKIYLAAAYARQNEMQGVRDVLEALGHEVTSTWIDRTTEPPGGIGAAELIIVPETAAEYARTDLADIDRTEVVVSFTGEGTRGGRHTDYGYALGRGKYLIGVGPREHIFHALANEWYRDWTALMLATSSSQPRSRLFRDEAALSVAARAMGVRPAFDPGCPLCDTDMHRCPGCSEPIEHGMVSCDQCAKL